jgi:hypothetical protein
VQHGAVACTTAAISSRYNVEEDRTVGDGLPPPRLLRRDGREEAEDLLERRSGDVTSRASFSTFNEPISDWLPFSCSRCSPTATGKYQLARAGGGAAFDPLARRRAVMLTEEAHHMFVGETGVAAS